MNFVQIHNCRSKVLINKGDVLTIPYISPHYRTEDRQRKLREGWYFDCTCSRCLDATELGAMTSAIKCHECNMQKNNNNCDNESKSFGGI